MSEKHIFPIVVRICRDVDDLFLTYVGPVGNLLCGETFDKWKETYKTGAMEIPYYIEMLAVQIPDNDKRVQFSREAMHLIANHIGI